MRHFLQTVLRNQSVLLYCSLMKGWIINGTDGLEACGNTVSVAFPVGGFKILNAFYAKKAKKPLKKKSENLHVKTSASGANHYFGQERKGLFHEKFVLSINVSTLLSCFPYGLAKISI